jgi:hypothetical protein
VDGDETQRREPSEAGLPLQNPQFWDVQNSKQPDRQEKGKDEDGDDWG